MMMKKDIVLNILCVLVLSGLFVHFFGLPSLEKFLSGGIYINTKQVELTKKETPAITICPRNQNASNSGWKKEKKYVEDACMGMATAEEIYRCIEENAFGLTELLRKGSGIYTRTPIVWNKLKDLRKISLWMPDITLILFGRCFTLNQSLVDFQPGLNLKLLLNPSLNYDIMFHDPEMFLFLFHHSDFIY